MLAIANSEVPPLVMVVSKSATAARILQAAHMSEGLVALIGETGARGDHRPLNSRSHQGLRVRNLEGTE